MPKSIMLIPVLAALSAAPVAAASDTIDSLQPVIDAAAAAVVADEVETEDGAPRCGRYHDIRTYRGKTCAEQIFEDIEMDAPGGA